MIHRRSFLRCAFTMGAMLAVQPLDTSAARLPTSTVTVDVLSVERESASRDAARYPGQPTVVFETSKYLAKARIIAVVRSDHGLRVGSVIDVRYDVVVREPPVRAFRVRPSLTAGDTVTIEVFGGNGSFSWHR